MTLSLFLDPGSFCERRDRGPRDSGVVLEAEVLEPFQRREPGVDQPAAFSSLSSLSGLGFQQRREIFDGRLLLADRLLGHRPELPAERRKL